MSDIRKITQFEFLPNEIFIECFEYLNAIHIFNAFNHLNSRLNHLIRCIPLHLTIEEIKPFAFLQFARDMSINPQIKKQIISFKLSGNDLFHNIKTLFSSISLNEFSHLQVLKISNSILGINSHISSKLPLLTNLQSVCLEYSDRSSIEIMESLATSTIRTLSIPNLCDTFRPTQQFTSLVNLTVSSCAVKELTEFFIHTPNLQYLDIGRFDISSYSEITNQSPSPQKQAVHLKRLAIENCFARFGTLEILLQQTPNLKVLQVSAADAFDMVDAYRWQKLIKASLPFLDVFRFQFSFVVEAEHSVLIDKFQEFQTEYWHQQHHWYTEYVLGKESALIYTIPYISNEYEMIAGDKRYFNQSFKSATTFARVTGLTFNIQAAINNDEYCFPNVKSIRLKSSYVGESKNDLHIECLKTMINLHNLVHLEIKSDCQWKSLSILLQLFKEASNLSSLRMGKTSLSALLQSRQLCEHFTKTIKKLDITPYCYDIYLNLDESAKLCEVFSNMEEFRCDIARSDNLEMILNRLSKLTHMKVFCYLTPYRGAGDQWFNDHKSELNSYSFTIKYECDSKEYDDDSSDIDD